jgi:preprotein translocase SecF subunit
MMMLIKIELSLVTLAALLAVAGYSVNDSIIIADRIREKLGMIKKESEEFIFNKAINETLSRTLLTLLTTLFAITALITLGRGALRDFASVLLVGFIVGTYSSIFIMSPLALHIRIWVKR